MKTCPRKIVVTDFPLQCLGRVKCCFPVIILRTQTRQYFSGKFLQNGFHLMIPVPIPGKSALQTHTPRSSTKRIAKTTSEPTTKSTTPSGKLTKDSTLSHRFWVAHEFLRQRFFAELSVNLLKRD